MKKRLALFILVSLISISIVSASQLKVTNNHPFLIDGKWIEASQLQVGDELTIIDGRKARITKITDILLDNQIPVYNLEDNYFHNYVADNIIVHNSNKYFRCNQCTKGPCIQDGRCGGIAPFDNILKGYAAILEKPEDLAIITPPEVGWPFGAFIISKNGIFRSGGNHAREAARIVQAYNPPIRPVGGGILYHPDTCKPEQIFIGSSTAEFIGFADYPPILESNYKDFIPLYVSAIKILKGFGSKLKLEGDEVFLYFKNGEKVRVVSPYLDEGLKQTREKITEIGIPFDK